METAIVDDDHDDHEHDHDNGDADVGDYFMEMLKYKTTTTMSVALRTQGHVQICCPPPFATSSNTLPSSLQILTFLSQTHLNVRRITLQNKFPCFLHWFVFAKARYGIHTDCAVDLV